MLAPGCRGGPRGPELEPCKLGPSRAYREGEGAVVWGGLRVGSWGWSEKALPGLRCHSGTCWPEARGDGPRVCVCVGGAGQLGGGAALTTPPFPPLGAGLPSHLGECKPDPLRVSGAQAPEGISSDFLTSPPPRSPETCIITS